VSYRVVTAQSTVTTTVLPTSEVESVTRSSTSKSSSATATPTSEAYTGCPATNGSTYTPLNAAAFNDPYQINGTNLEFEILCNTNFAGGGSTFNLGIVDVQILYQTPTLDACITQCASYNYALSSIGSPPWNLLCSGVVYSIPQSTTEEVSCFLKTGVRNDATDVPTGEKEIVTAVLQWQGES